MNEQPDAEPQDVREDADVEKIAAVRRAIKEAWLVDGDKTDLDADRLALAARAALAQSDAEPVAQNVLDALEDYLTHAGFNLIDGDVERIARVVLTQSAAPPRPDASGLIEAAEFTDQLFSLAFDRCEIESCEIMELGEKLGLLEKVAYDPKIHPGDIDADEGDVIFVRSAKGKSVTRAADRSGK